MDKTKKQKDFAEWVVAGIEKGYLQEIDKQFRKQYGISELCSTEQWREVKKHFTK